MTGAVSLEDTAGIVLRLAQNFGAAQGLDDQDAAAALVSTWYTALRGSWQVDVAEAMQVCITTHERMPSVAQFRALVAAAADRRHRLPGAHRQACEWCDGHQGFEDAGDDEEGRYFVTPCRNGCQAVTHHEATRRGRAHRKVERDDEGARRWAAGIALLRQALADPTAAKAANRPAYTPPPRQLALPPSEPVPAAWNEEF